MPLIARASSTVRNKNLIIVAMCLFFCLWFLRDAYMRYPEENDKAVKNGALQDDATTELKDLASKWTRWDSETPESRQAMNDVLKTQTGAETKRQTGQWHQPLDVLFQEWLAWGLVGCTALALWWFIHCQRRRAIADETTVSPAPGVVIPWDKITKVDNTRWKSVGIVDITYTDAQGVARKANFDDYKLKREPLLPILEMLAEKAVNAEFLPKAEAASAPESGAPTPPQSSDTPQA